MRRLEPEEVPEEYRHLFLYEKQRICYLYGNRTGLKIERLCIQCNNTYEVTVHQIRADFKRGRRMRGKCMGCRKDGIVIKEGYIWIYMPEHPNAYGGKYVPQHTLVMENKLKRYIDGKNESIHHIDGNRANNSLSNLQLRKRYHGAGQAWECLDCGGDNISPVHLKSRTSTPSK